MIFASNRSKVDQKFEFVYVKKIDSQGHIDKDREIYKPTNVKKRIQLSAVIAWTISSAHRLESPETISSWRQNCGGVLRRITGMMKRRLASLPLSLRTRSQLGRSMLIRLAGERSERLGAGEKLAGVRSE